MSPPFFYLSYYALIKAALSLSPGPVKQVQINCRFSFNGDGVVRGVGMAVMPNGPEFEWPTAQVPIAKAALAWEPGGPRPSHPATPAPLFASAAF